MSVWGTGWHLFSVLAVNGTVQSKHTLTQTHKRSELAASVGWNKPVSSEENRRTEGKTPVVLIGIPSS